MAKEISYVELFRRYEEVRKSGKYNMIMDSVKAAKAAKLTAKQYKYVITHYNELKEVYNEYISNLANHE